MDYSADLVDKEIFSKSHNKNMRIITIYAKYILFIIASSWCVSECVVVQRVVVPIPGVVGTAVRLECQWSTGDGPPLYSLRWTKDGDQFYAIIMQPLRRKQYFPTPGVMVMLSHSHDRVVVLSNVTAETAGEYTCEAMSDAPDFLSSQQSANLTVIELPRTGPILTGISGAYHIGHDLRAECHTYSSMPSANLSFIINDIIVPAEGEWVTQITEYSSSLSNSSITFKMQLTTAAVMNLFPKYRHMYTYQGQNYYTQLSTENLHSIGESDDKTSYLTNNESFNQTPIIYSYPGSAKPSGDPAFTLLSPQSWPEHLNISITCLANIGGVKRSITTNTLITVPSKTSHPDIKSNTRNIGTEHRIILGYVLLILIFLHHII